MDRRSSGRADVSSSCRSAAALSAILLSALIAGCGPATQTARPVASKSPSKAKFTSCGSARTAANVPVDIEITQGTVACGTAIAIEQDYANAIRSGKAPGNGGGGPVQVKGWTCQGFATPVVLKTGKASKCVRDGQEILAVLPPPSD